jgi:hypothetical protein
MVVFSSLTRTSGGVGFGLCPWDFHNIEPFEHVRTIIIHNLVWSLWSHHEIDGVSLVMLLTLKILALT